MSGLSKLLGLAARAMAEEAPALAVKRTVPAAAKRAVQPIRAYHGTPHRFAAERLVQTPQGERRYIRGAVDQLPDLPPQHVALRDMPLGRFSTERIGTGEGNQSYGRGLYFAENEDVAKNYRENVKDKARYEAVIREMVPHQRTMWDDIGSMTKPNVHTLPMNTDAGRAAQAEWLRLAAERDAILSDPGALYHADLNVDPERMLDWDRAIFDQPGVMRALEPLAQKYQLSYGTPTDKYPTMGGDLMGRLRARFRDDPAALTGALQDAGIQGVRYLDAGSRYGDPAARTRNLVVFDDENVDIAKRFKCGGRVKR